MGIKEIAGVRVGPETPQSKAGECVRSNFSGAPENKMAHRGGIRRGFIRSDVEWILRTQQMGFKSRMPAFAIGVINSPAGESSRSVGIGLGFLQKFSSHLPLGPQSLVCEHSISQTASGRLKAGWPLARKS
jgi:hypothetical protein